jgi:CMP-N-acetylneuraminic acid synthetase
MRTEITAIIVARKGSVRVKSKSMLKLGNETLISRKIKQLQAAKHINRVVFGSDSDEMLEHARSCGVEVFRRPDFYCDETKASANDMIENMLSLIKTDIVVWAHCTNPLLSSETYNKAISAFLNNQEEYDSLLSVKEFKEHLWDENKKPLNYNPYQTRHVPARELPAYYMQDGGIFIQPYKQMLLNKYFFGKKPYLFVIPDEEFLDINDERDYLLAKAILDNKND